MCQLRKKSEIHIEKTGRENILCVFVVIEWEMSLNAEVLLSFVEFCVIHIFDVYQTKHRNETNIQSNRWQFSFKAIANHSKHSS